MVFCGFLLHGSNNVQSDRYFEGRTIETPAVLRTLHATLLNGHCHHNYSDFEGSTDAPLGRA